MKKKGFALLLVLVLGFTCFLAACAQKEFTFTLTFYNDTEGTEVLDVITAKREKEIQPTTEILHNDDEEMEFAGWYLNKYCEEKDLFSKKDFSANAMTNIPVYPKWVKKGSVGILYDLLPNDTYQVSGIGSFEGSELVIPEIYNGKSVSLIGANAFEGCNQFTKVTLPATLKRIMSGAFKDCENIRSFVLPDAINLDYIGNDAFAGCDNAVFYTPSSDSDSNILNGWGNWNVLDRPVYYDVKTVYEVKSEQGSEEEQKVIAPSYEYILTNNVVSSGNDEEEKDENAEENENAGGNEQSDDYHIYFTRYTGNEEEVNIPLNFYTHEGEMIIGENATLHIGQYAFDDCDVKISFPTTDNGQTGGIGTLDDYAFAGYLGESIDIPDSVVAVGRNVFYGTAAEFDLGKIADLRTLTDYFYAGYLGEVIRIPASVVTLGQYVFSDATSEIEFAEENKITRIAAYSFANYKGETLELPASITEIDRFAFVGAEADVVFKDNAVLKNNTLVQNAFINYKGKSVVLPSTLETIEARAFYNSSNLETIKIPASVKQIGDNAFYGCDSLTEVELEGGNGYTVVDGVLYADNGETLVLYPAAKDADTFEVPVNVKTIKQNAFRNAVNLTSITLPAGLKKIENSAFENCGSLTFILIPGAVTDMGDDVFKGCSSLRIALESANLPAAWKNFNPDGCEVALNSGALIDAGEFRYLKKSDGLAIMNYTGSEATVEIKEYNGQKIIEIGPNAFDGNTELKKIILPSSVVTIGVNAFRNSGLESVEAADGQLQITDIGASAFEGTHITALNLPALKTLGVAAFRNSELSSINFGNEITEFSDNLFEGTKLESYSVPENITELGNEVFANTPLQSIVIPSTVEQIGSAILKGCADITEISIGYIGKDRYATNNTINAYLFDAPSGLNNFELTLTKTETTTEEEEKQDKWPYVLPGQWLSNAGNITKVTLPETVIEISASALFNCVLLREVEFLGHVKKIQTQAFADCKLLETIDLSEVQYIGESAFNGCEVLDDITLTNNLVSEDANTKPLNRYAFSDCKSLTSITIPNTVTDIPEYCFNGCLNLTTVSFNGTINEIGAYAFRDCESLTEMVINFGNSPKINQNAFTRCGGSETKITLRGNIGRLENNAFNEFLGVSVDLDPGIVELGSYVFQNSENLQEVTAPGVTTINENAFDGCSSLKTFDMTKVTKISCYVFQDCATLDHITLNNGLTSMDPDDQSNPNVIPKYTFARCSSLRDINLGSGVTEIRHHAFSGCSALKNSTNVIKSNIKTIGDYAFENCTNLQEVSIGREIKIGAYSFNGCTKVIIRVSMTKEEARTAWGTNELWMKGARFIFNGQSDEDLYVDALGVVYEKEKDDSGNEFFVLAAYAGSGSLTIESQINGTNVTKVGEGAFAGVDGFTSITLPATVTEIGNSAFEGCPDLESVVAPGVTTLGTAVFADCVKLQTVQLGNVGIVRERTFENCLLMTKIEIKANGWLTVEKDAFANVTASIEFSVVDGTNVTLGDYALRNYKGSEFSLGKVTEIGKYAFYGSTANIIFKGTETKISDYEFNGYMGTSITIPASVTTIGNSAFANCVALESLTIPASVTTLGSKAFENLAIEIKFDDGSAISEIGAGAFSGYQGESIEIPASVKTLGASVFENSQLTSITVPNGVTSIGDKAFSGCSKLERISIFGNLESLGASAFANCTLLDTIEFFGEDVKLTEIKERTFYNCSTLTSIDLPDSVEKLGANAFCGCENITKLTLPEKLTSIGDDAFNMCSSLPGIAIPASVETLGERVFANCTSLEIINVNAENKNYTSDNGVLYNFAQTELICYPAAKKGTSYEILGSVTEIHTYAFAYNTYLTEIIISKGVTKMGSKAFFGCVNILIKCESENIPAGFASDWNFCIGNVNGTNYCSVITAYKKEA